MLRITQTSNAAGAKSYYSTSDYYLDGQELPGVWGGKGAKRLALSGAVEREAWERLCDNRHPATGGVLTARQRTNRRVGYDFNFHVPKSVSLLYGLTQDERILGAFRTAVRFTMREMESELKTRVRKGGRNEDRVTGNMVWGEFIHTTARPVGGVPDPHLHAHCLVFNTTWDDTEQRWKAGQFADLKRDAPYFEARFHSRLARAMETLGLKVERTRRGWELAGIASQTLGKYSRRTALIEERSRKDGITDPALKGELGAKTRERKQSELGLEELQHVWTDRLTSKERNAFADIQSRIGDSALAPDERAAKRAAILAVDHCLERQSVVAERRLLAEAMKRSYGTATPDMIERAVQDRNLIVGERDGNRVATTRAVLDEELRMLDFARNGRGTCRRLGREGCTIKRDWLSKDQRSGVKHVLTTQDRVILVRGRAGSGKTSLMQEAVEQIEANGRRVFTFAPSAGASRGVLRSEGFADADTVARLLVDTKLQERVGGAVLWIDEAGLLGSRQMAQLFDVAERVNARVILSGDTGQHGPVERGAALRLLEVESGLVPSNIREIQRQSGEYKRAIEALSAGRTAEGFRRLDAMGCIREVNEPERYKLLASEYLKASSSPTETALVVSPTHLEGEWITDEVRSRLKERGTLGQSEQRLHTLVNANLTEAERRDPINYSPGDVLVFHQNATGVRKGSRLVVGRDALPLSEAAKFQVFHPDILPVAAGERIRITRNGKTADGAHRLNNGDIFTVKRFDLDGNIVLTNGWIVAAGYGHLAHGYVVTSHQSQGKTVDHVLVGQSASFAAASSAEQFYVSASRGKKSVTVFTDDKRALLEAVRRSDDSLTATELVSGRYDLQPELVAQRMHEQFAVMPRTLREQHAPEGALRDR